MTLSWVAGGPLSAGPATFWLLVASVRNLLRTHASSSQGGMLAKPESFTREHSDKNRLADILPGRPTPAKT
jgi:hypothetical protein